MFAAGYETDAEGGEVKDLVGGQYREGFLASQNAKAVVAAPAFFAIEQRSQ